MPANGKPLFTENSDQYAALCIIGYLEDLFTLSPLESFTKISILSVLNNVKNDSDLFEPEAVIAYDQIDHEEPEA
jgi:hypothetical protein